MNKIRERDFAPNGIWLQAAVNGVGIGHKVAVTIRYRVPITLKQSSEAKVRNLAAQHFCKEDVFSSQVPMNTTSLFKVGHSFCNL